MMSDLHPSLVNSTVVPGTAQAALAVAEFYAKLKYSEKPKNSNHTIFGAWYGVQTAWCAMFVSYCLNHSGSGATVNGAQSKRGFALCSAGIRWFKKKGAWFPVGKAQPGDVAFFDWNHDHSPEHTGFIVKVDLKRKRVLTIEGNTGPKNLSNGGAVMKQWRDMASIMGVGRPAYAGVVAPVAPVVAPVTPAEPVVAAFKAIKVGSKGANVKAVQAAVGAGADGVFGPKTEAAVKVWQKKVGLPITGIIDSVAWSKIVGK
jgi:peptidoglycan hydrolase-like protein with peptidoglycan-binding domain